jgi:hypothetical protein
MDYLACVMYSSFYLNYCLDSGIPSSQYSFHMDCYLPECDITLPNEIIFPLCSYYDNTIRKISSAKGTESRVDEDDNIILQQETALLCFMKKRALSKN